MKRLAIIAIALGLLCSATASFAQRGGPGRNRAKAMSPEERMKKLSAELNLTDEQKEKVRPVIEDEMKQLKDIRQDSSLSRDQKIAKAREVHADAMGKIRPILTDDQQKKLDEMVEQAKERLQQGRAAN
jgi:Spy/CpxP family protein refolding chaperone